MTPFHPHGLKRSREVVVELGADSDRPTSFEINLTLRTYVLVNSFEADTYGAHGWSPVKLTSKGEHFDHPPRDRRVLGRKVQPAFLS